MTSLETDRLRLRPLTQDDLPDVHRMHSDPQTVRFASGRLKSLQESREWLRWAIGSYERRASRRVAEKVGLRVEKSATHKGVDVLIYSIEASERGDREPCAET